jgi:hypothetical protein
MCNGQDVRVEKLVADLLSYREELSPNVLIGSLMIAF